MPTRPILDPRKVNEATGSVPKPRIEIPPRIRRQFGFSPDFDKLHEGDLVLVSAIEKPWDLQKIVDSQDAGGYATEDSCWHHAAVYIGNRIICEARKRAGVQLGSLYDYVGPNFLLLFRRPRDLTPEMRCQIAIYSLCQLHKPYSLKKIFTLYKQCKEGLWHPLAKLARQGSDAGTICSKVYSDAYYAATKMVLRDVSFDSPLPAQLSRTSSLVDIPVSWLRIPRS